MSYDRISKQTEITTLYIDLNVRAVRLIENKGIIWPEPGSDLK